MKINVPVSKAGEVAAVIEAGASEIYCGVLPLEWYRKYSNVASVNRAETIRSNIENFNELKQAVKIAHSYNVPVSFALNSIYTQEQYLLLDKYIEQAVSLGIDAFIVADIGLLLKLKDMNIGKDVHISTGGTVFNSYAVKFYQHLGAKRVIIPRQMRIQEIDELTRENDSVEKEVFILNSGCRYVTGFCGFQHGLEEVRYKYIWKIAEKLNLGHRLLGLLRRLPRKVNNFINDKTNFFGSAGACMLNYNISPAIDKDVYNGDVKQIIERISSGYFDLFYGIDTCGVCALYRLRKMKINNLKIVGRGNETSKKVKDTRFVHTALEYLNNEALSEKQFRLFVREKYKEIYRIDCREFCYYD